MRKKKYVQAMQTVEEYSTGIFSLEFLKKYRLANAITIHGLSETSKRLMPLLNVGISIKEVEKSKKLLSSNPTIREDSSNTRFNYEVVKRIGVEIGTLRANNRISTHVMNIITRKYRCGITVSQQYIPTNKSRMEAIDNLHRAIQSKRQAQRTMKTTPCRKSFPHILPYHLVGGIHLTSGQILRIRTLRFATLALQPKNPPKTMDAVGIEIEMVSKHSKEELAQQLSNYRMVVHVHGDGSLRNEISYPNTVEISFFDCKDNIHNTIKEICGILNKSSKANYTCGLHVHLDCRSKSIEEKEYMFYNLQNSQNLLYNMNPPSRRVGGSNHNYCIKRWDGMQSVSTKYNGVSSLHLINGGKNSIEIRIHEGTTNSDDICNWVKLLLAIAYSKKAIETRICTLGGLKKYVDLTQELEDYIKKRIEMYDDHLTNEKETEPTERRVANV